ncbi:MAG: hypothetical protein GXY08_00040 [Ruminococcus sp.]|nr:hypothetical protein [Ruminococcus sp.]
MEITVASRGNRYTVEDKNQKTMYNVKKKGFGQRYVILDMNNYNLYTLIQTGDERRPFFSIVLNDDTFLKMECKSMFLDPTMIASGKNMKYELKSKDRKNFEIIFNEKSVGKIETKVGVTGDLQYDIEIDNKAFDDYIPLFAVAIDKAFGEMNKQKK